MNTDLLTMFNQIGHPKILVLGDIILDRYTWGNAERVSPEAPVLVLKVESYEVRLGGAASVAHLLRALEAEVTLAGVIGNDANGRVVRRLLDESGIDARLVLCDEIRPTTTKERFLGRADGKHPHQVLRVDQESGKLLAPEIERDMAHQISERLDEFDAVLVSDYGKGVCWSIDEFRTYTIVGKPTHSRNTENDGETAAEEVDLGGLRMIEVKPPEPTLLKSVIKAANVRGIPILVDPARGALDPDLYRGATLLKPNRVEAQLTNGFKIDSPVAAMRAGERLCERLGIAAAVITLDRDGMVLSQPGAPSEHFTTPPRPVCDITGAGDTAFAMLGLALCTRHPNDETNNNLNGGVEAECTSPQAQDETTGTAISHPSRKAGTRLDSVYPKHVAPLQHDSTPPNPSLSPRTNLPSDLEKRLRKALPYAVRLANVASGLQVERFGVTAVTRDEIRKVIREEILQGFIGPPEKLTNLDELQLVVEKYRQDGKTTVFTNGCFDLLHVGHLTCLQQAARQGDILIVAINSDRSVRKLKGPERPLIGQKERAAMLAGLECVDHVLIFDEPTPHELLWRIRPDVLVKGGTTPDVVGREIVERYGGRVERTSEVCGLSTTNLLSRMQSHQPAFVEENT